MGGVPPGASTEREALINARVRRRLARESIVYAEGDESDRAWFVLDGLVKVRATGLDGTTALVAFRGPGDWLGEHGVVDGRPRTTTAVVACDATLVTVHRGDFEQAVRDTPGFASELLAVLARQVREAVRHELELASLDPPALVARRLQLLATSPRFAPTRSARDGTISIAMPVSHEELASWAGVSRRSVEAALHGLRAIGAITTGRMRIDVHDVATLRHTAGEPIGRPPREVAPA